MIEYKSGNILAEDAEALVNTVNCVGVMGRGIALQFKKAFPENFEAYARVCQRKEMQPGKMFVYDIEGLTNPRYIINFPTKRHWRGNSRIEDIEAGLRTLVAAIRQRDIRSIAIPPLGCGLGGLQWSSVKQRIEQALAGLDEVRIVIFEPGASPVAEKMPRNREIPEMTQGRAALVELMRSYLSGLLDPFVTLLEVHKLMYFLQQTGEPLKLRYKKAHYGPYAENLGHVLNAMEGHLISGYADGGDDPSKQLELVPGAVEDAERFLQDHADTHERLERVRQLVEGFESPFGLELLASTHWVMDNEPVSSRDEIIAHVHGWNSRKQQFSPRQINIAMDVLASKNWATLN